MSVSSIFTLCFVLYQVQGAPQDLSLAWLNPPSVLNMQIRPRPIAPMYSALQEQMYTAQDEDTISLMNHPQLFADPNLGEVNNDNYPHVVDQSRQAFPQQCDPRKLFRRTVCVNDTVVRTCSIGGTYSDSPCPTYFRCIPYFGMCLPQLSRRLQTFTCPSVPGTYPDPRNCMVYHECPQGNASSPITTMCSWPQIYDPISMACQMETPERPCYKINCIGQQTAAYPGDANIYAQCSRSGTVQTLNRCQYGLGWVEQSNQCEPYYCIREGNIPAAEPNQYYTCSRIFKRLIRSEIKTCMTSFVFNETLGYCSPSIQSQARIPTSFVETLYHEVPNVTDLLKKVPDMEATQTPSNDEVVKPMEEEATINSPHLQHDLFTYGMPVPYIQNHAVHPAVPHGMNFANNIPFIM